VHPTASNKNNVTNVSSATGALNHIVILRSTIYLQMHGLCLFEWVKFDQTTIREEINKRFAEALL
jgi:hypothetical protein